MQSFLVGGVRCVRGVRARALVNRAEYLAPSLLLALCMASAQTTPGDSKGQNQIASATAASSVDPMSLYLVVHDKSHKPYANLKPEDLQVLDNDKPMTLKELRRVTADESTEHVVTFVSDRFGGTLGRNEQSIAGRILKELPSKGYSFAVLDLVPRLRLIQGFTTDRSAVKDAVRVVTEGPKNGSQVIELTASNTVFQKGTSDVDDPSSAAAKKAEKNLVSIVRTGSSTISFTPTAAARWNTTSQSSTSSASSGSFVMSPTTYLKAACAFSGSMF